MTATASDRFLAALETEGFDFFTGVPCSLLSGVIRALEREPRYGYVSAVREDAAVGLAAGAWMGGALPAVFLQNSGLGVSINALASLSLMYEMPALLVVSWRGCGPDAPEHVLTGAVTQSLLATLGREHAVLDAARIPEQVRDAAALLRRTNKPTAILVKKGILDS